jgi:hypothetical protein
VTTNPFLYSLDALERAEEFYEAFRQLPPPPGRWISWPRYHLLCHAIELGLKAFLSSRGVTILKLRAAFGHKIGPLMKQAVSEGLKIGPLGASQIMLLDEAHTKHWPRYPREDGGPVFAIETFEPYARELLRAVSISIRGSDTSPYGVKY